MKLDLDTSGILKFIPTSSRAIRKNDGHNELF